MVTTQKALSNYNQLLISDVLARSTVEGNFPTEQFTVNVCELLGDSGEFSDVQLAYLNAVGKRRRKLRVDAYDLTREDDAVTLVVTDFAQDELSSVATAETRSNLISGSNFLKECIQEEFLYAKEESDPVYQLAFDLLHLGMSLTKYKVYYITNSLVPESFKVPPQESINGVPIEFHLWDLRRLHTLAESVGQREPLEIDITAWDQEGLPALRVSNECDFTTYLAVLQGEMVADMYEMYGSRLLESNVRSYLSNRGKVNKSIRETVIAKPDHFIAYNNGITATATAVSVDEKSGNIVSISDLQIVNGGQTTASLFYVRRDPRANVSRLDGISVPMKLVVVDAEIAEALVPNISRFANSQNAVSASDFFSNHPFHQRLEELGKRVLAPVRGNDSYQTRWFYERTKGQYQSEKGKLSRSDQTRFERQYPRVQVLTKTDVAKFEMSWLQKPHVVSAGAQKNFVQFANAIENKWKVKSGDEQFNEQYYKEVVAKAILFNSLRRGVINSNWYKSGYLANIVTYTIAKLSHSISLLPMKEMNFDDIWSRGEMPVTVLPELVSLAEKIAMLLDSRTREVTNVTEWAKKESCWNGIREDFNWTVPEAILSWLVDTSVAVGKKATAADKQRLDNKLKTVTEIFDYPAEEWRGLQDFLVENNRVASDGDLGILRLITALEQKVPTDAQAARLWKMVDRARSYGFGGLR